MIKTKMLCHSCRTMQDPKLMIHGVRLRGHNKLYCSKACASKAEYLSLPVPVPRTSHE